MKFLRPITLVVLILSVLLACNDKKENEKELAVAVPAAQEEQAGKFKTQGNQMTDTATTPPQNPQLQQQGKSGSRSTVDWDKKIVKTATINVEIKNFKSFTELIRDNIKRSGAYAAQEEQIESNYKIENRVTIKVPVDQFDNLVAELTKGEEKITEKKITSEDVTTDIVDTKSRLEAKKQVRLRYLDLLKQARNMQEILSVQNEVNDIQEDIEAASGRIEYLSHASAYSTINLISFQVLNASAKDASEPSYGTKLWLSFKNGWNWIGDVLVGLISIWPLFLLGFACWFGYKKWMWAKMHKRNA